MADDTTISTEPRIGRVEMEITIDAPRERVWRALVEETPDWWRPEFHAIKNSRFIIEARPGGRAYEDAGDGNGLVWYNVVGVIAPASLQLAGHLFSAYGGPAVTLVSIELTETPEGGTALKLTDSLLGRFNERELAEGWPYLFEGGLKKYVEGGR
jgi:uncharacterized protein YndB with AHSA1/START domain